jgi:hypothetical protein
MPARIFNFRSRASPLDRFQLAACGGGDMIDLCMPAEVTVNSPMLMPGGSASFIIKEVIHRQSSAEGTTTDILITNENGLGSESLQGAS